MSNQQEGCGEDAKWYRGRRTERNEYWFQLEGVEKSEVSGEKILLSSRNNQESK